MGTIAPIVLLVIAGVITLSAAVLLGFTDYLPPHWIARFRRLGSIRVFGSALIISVLFLIYAGLPQQAPIKPAETPTETESIFQNEVTTAAEPVPWWKFWRWNFDPAADKIREWRSARADHRLVALAILFCKNSGQIEPISGDTFRALLLDLTPDGDHVFKKAPPPPPPRPVISPPGTQAPRAPGKIELDANDRFLLSLSDSISRTRLAAVYSAAGSVTAVFWLGILTLFVSGLTTLFVTLQGRIASPVPGPAPTPTTPAHAAVAVPPPVAGAAPAAAASGPGGTGADTPPVSPPPAQPPSSPRQRSGLTWIGFFAIFFSILGTALVAFKQFYDPSRLVVQNERVLPKLWSLHQEIILGFRCENGKIEITPDKDKNAETKLASWASQMRELRSQIVLEYGAYVSGLPQTSPPNSQ